MGASTRAQLGTRVQAEADEPVRADIGASTQAQLGTLVRAEAEVLVRAEVECAAETTAEAGVIAAAMAVPREATRSHNSITVNILYLFFINLSFICVQK